MKNTFVKAMEDWCEDQPEAITYTPTDPSGLSFSVPDEDVRAWYAASHFDQNPYRVNEKGIRHIISFTGVAKFQIA